MYGIRHGIEQEFPEFLTTIHERKQRDPLFGRLLAAYDDTDKKIYGLEQLQLPVADDYFTYLKRQRVKLKDQLYSLLRARP